MERTADHIEEKIESLLTLELKISRFGVSEKKHDSNEFYSLDDLGSKVRSNRDKSNQSLDVIGENSEERNG